MIFDILLARAKAWKLSANKNLTTFFDSLLIAKDEAKNFIDRVWLDIFPQTTRQLDEWEQQLGLENSGLPEQERRDRLAGRWRAKGGSDPFYIQRTLQEAGFNVYVHEFWNLPLTTPHTVRDPQAVLRDDNNELPDWVAAAGRPNTLCGRQEQFFGDVNNKIGYPLVNILPASQPPYVVPSDPTKWPYFMYIGGQIYPEIATVPFARKDEFEDLCLRICPTQQWLGILVEYT